MKYSCLNVYYEFTYGGNSHTNTEFETFNKLNNGNVTGSKKQNKNKKR